MNKINNTEPYQINNVVATWLTASEYAIGAFVDFNINDGDLVTHHEFKKGIGGEADTLIYYIKDNPDSGLTEVVSHKNSLYAQTDNSEGLEVLLIVNGHVCKNIPFAVRYIKGLQSTNFEAYEINYLSAACDGTSVYVIINMMIFKDDIVCDSIFCGGVGENADNVTVNVISNMNPTGPLVPYTGIYGPFSPVSWGVGANALVNGSPPPPLPPSSKPIGIKSYGSDTDKQHSKQPN